MSLNYYQFGYVTTDLDRAIDEIGRMHQIGSFMILNDCAFEIGNGKEAVAHFALAFKGDTQFELIQPIGGDVGAYLELLPEEDGYALRFHHLGRHFESRAECDAHIENARTRWAIPMESPNGEGYFAYADARADFGHFLEFFSFPADSHLADVPRC